MSISARTVMELRAKTNAGMMDCKKALIETDGDMEAAVIWLREKGISKAAKKAGRIAAEGLVFCAVSDDDKIGVLVEFNSETDFVAKNKDFLKFGEFLADTVLSHKVSDTEELKNLTIEGKNIENRLNELIATIGENLSIRRFVRIESEDFITTYLHMGGKIGVVLNLHGKKSEENLTKAKDIAMHIAAMAPDYLDESEITEEVLEKEKSIIRVQLLEEGKPENIINKIMTGKINKFYEENCLLHQKFVKDDKISVAQYAADLKIVQFVRYKLGEGLDKRSDNFASEVAAQMKG